MTTLGYSLSSEEFDAPTLVALAERAERAGFSFAGISDHFHPWVDAQGESPFVWGVLGATILGLIFSVLYLLTGSIWVVIVVHAFVDLRSLVLLPLVVQNVWRKTGDAAQ